MRNRWNKLVPPGTDLKSEFAIYGAMLGIMMLISLRFLSKFRDARLALYEWNHNRMILISGAVMKDLDELMAGRFAGLILVFLGCVVMVVLHYMSFYGDSRCIYLMKRISNPWELHKRCILLPVICFVVGVLLSLVLMSVYSYIYIHNTPAECLPKNTTFHIWRSII